MMSLPTSHTSPITIDQTRHLQLLLEMKGFTFSEKPYAIFSAAKKDDKVNVTVYEKGPKVLVQGKGTKEFIEFVLEPEVLDLLSPDCTFEQEPLQTLAATDQLAVYAHDGFWKSIDTYREYLEINRMWTDGDRPWAIWEGGRR